MKHRISSLLQIKLGWKTNGLANSLIVNLKDRQPKGKGKLTESMPPPKPPLPPQTWTEEEGDYPLLSKSWLDRLAPQLKHIDQSDNSLHLCGESVYLGVSLSSVIFLTEVFRSNYIALSGRGASAERNRCHYCQSFWEESDPGKKLRIRETSPRLRWGQKSLLSKSWRW